MTTGLNLLGALVALGVLYLVLRPWLHAYLKVYAWSEVLDKRSLPGRSDLGVLRLRTVVTKDRACVGFPYKIANGKYDPAVVLDLDYVVLMPTLRSS